MHRPNFFIVGAPKSGTTALYHHLRAHPEIFMPDHKELHFFAKDLTSPQYRMDEQTYLAYFDQANGAKRIGEAGVWYLYSRCAAEEIRRFDPSAKIIAMLRNPVEMIYSYHTQRLFNGTEDIVDFEQALAAEQDRKRGLRLPQNPYPIEALYYREIALYHEQVLRYFRAFGRENIHVIIFDDFKRDVHSAFRETFEFLGVDSRFEPPLADSDLMKNASRRVRSKMFRRFLESPPNFVTGPVKLLIPQSLRRQLWMKLRNLNTKWAARPQMAAALKSRLTEYYTPDIENLSQLMGRDLAGLWGCQARDLVRRA
jgi:hypothetical protein